MSYITLYRKYRPRNFDEVYGQTVIIKTLINSIKHEKINHAYLFSGTRGTGKTSVAKVFAKTINCTDLKNGINCNKCEICKIKDLDSFQDIIEIDAASNNGVDEIRELKSKINLVPTLCKYKVYIIDEVHMLSMGAFNALLKTLEEPPKHAIFILATTEPQKIPETILSRCQRFEFKKIDCESLEKGLKKIAKKEGIDIDKEALDLLIKTSSGSFRDALVILEQASSYSNKKIKIKDIYDITGTISNKKTAEIITYLIKNDIEKTMKLWEEMRKESKDLTKIVENILQFIKNILLHKKTPKYFNKIEIYDKELIEKISNETTEIEIITILKKTNQLLSELKKTTDASILFELYLLGNIEIEEDYEKKQKTIEKKVEEKIEKIKKEEKVLDKEKEILLNNTLFFANKKDLNDSEKIKEKVNEYLLNDKYKVAAGILLDSKICAAGKEYILFTYKYQSIVSAHDDEKKKIENILKEIIGKKVTTVAITEEEWKYKRPKYIEKKKNNELCEIKIIEPKREKNIEEISNIALCEFGKELIEMEV